jgi:hypothetical protein
MNYFGNDDMIEPNTLFHMMKLLKLFLKNLIETFHELVIISNNNV